MHKVGKTKAGCATPAAKTLPDGDVVARLEDLRCRFEAFRRGNRRYARIPESLRAATVAAHEHGVTAEMLRQTCGVSLAQLALWAASHGTPPAASHADADRARVFAVVDDLGPAVPAAQGIVTEGALELRLGQWSVTIRMADR